MRYRVNGPTDTDMLAEACRIVREAVPNPTHLLLATSDQQAGHGFTLTDVRLRDGSLLSEVEPDSLDLLREDTHEALCDLDWDAEVGEDVHGNAELLIGGRA